MRNWDYRYTWIRDAAFTLYAFLRLGFSREAEAFMHFLSDRARECDEGTGAPLQIMYGIDGRHELAGVRARPPRGLPAARGRCASATAPPTSCSSTSTAS